MTKRNKVRKPVAYLALIAAQVTTGINIVGSKSLLTHLPILFMLCSRFFIATLFLLVIHFLTERQTHKALSRISKKDSLFILLQGLCAGAFFNLLMLLGLQHSDASVAGIITSALPAIIALFALVFLRERMTLFTAACISFSIIGLLLINLHSFQHASMSHLWGNLLIFLSLLPEAAYYILIKIHRPKLPIFLLAALVNGTNLLVLLPMSFLLGHFSQLTLGASDIFMLVVIGISSALFYVFWFIGCQKVSGTNAGLLTAFMPIATLLLAWVYLGEGISLMQAAGMGLIMLAIGFNAGRRRGSG